MPRPIKKIIIRKLIKPSDKINNSIYNETVYGDNLKIELKSDGVIAITDNNELMFLTNQKCIYIPHYD